MMGTGYVSPWQYWWNTPIREYTYTWTLQFIFLPRKTEYNKWIWFTNVYRGTRVIHGPGTPVILEKWLTPEEFTWFQLTRE